MQVQLDINILQIAELQCNYWILLAVCSQLSGSPQPATAAEVAEASSS